MTEKQTRILDSALLLFSEYGVDSTSTNKIAQTAQVSEGLIFKHFGSKSGLLFALTHIAANKVQAITENISKLSNPMEQIRAILEYPFFIPEEDYPLWRLVQSIQWKDQFQTAKLLEPLKTKTIRAFKELKYSNPEIEATLIQAYTEGFFNALLLKNIKKDILLKTVRKKYKWIT